MYKDYVTTLQFVLFLKIWIFYLLIVGEDIVYLNISKQKITIALLRRKIEVYNFTMKSIKFVVDDRAPLHWRLTG